MGPAHGSSALRSVVRPYVCPSCLVQTVAARNQQYRQLSNRNTTSSPSTRTSRALQSPRKGASESRARTRQRNTSRHFSHATPKLLPNGNNALASRSAINAPSTVPTELRDLHQQLSLLEEKASSYVDLSQLKLALRSLESEDPIVRIAFVGLGEKGYQAARKLVRILCADALGEEAEWEQKLLQVNKDGGSLLLRYGENGQLGARTGAVDEMQIPSLFLKKGNLEILINGLNPAATTGAEESGLEDSLLVPTLTIPGAGRVGFVRFPVHKTVVVAEGVSGALEVGRLPAFGDGKMVHAALNLPLRLTAAVEDASTVDIDLAAHALSLFRASNSNGAQFSSEWQASRVGSVSSWIAAAADPSKGTHGVKPAVGDLVSGLLNRTSNSVSAAESSARSSSTSLTVPELRRAALQQAIAAWSEKSHSDLQYNLAHALLSPTWRRTVWWRLFWRIDEVSISASDVMIRGWLVEAEQNLAWLSGRVSEAGLASAAELKADSEDSVEGLTELPEEGLRAETDGFKSQRVAGEEKAAETLTSLGAAVLKRPPPVFIPVSARDGRNAIFDPPWPQTIHLAREQTLYRAVPALHLKAQVLMLSSLSTIGGSGALGAWLWLASGGTMIYEAGAVAALGLVWGLRRLQGKWSQERNAFVNTVVENGRTVLADVEARLRRLVESGGRVNVKEDETKEWNAARQGVRGVQQALAKLGETQNAVDFTERHFHEGLRDQYGPGYRHDPAAQFQYYGGWDGYAGRAVTDDWRQQFMDMQREGRYQMPYYGGFW
ncbi:hypothetical protein TI39_contig4246g00007 [Zymoseptoria brevis]|uniref:Mmc1 C-terminal domain-containing protein n=1 Tax=Zymoseptoria brevis TaxID=1047168 RepID=A0A0F4G912_9PEZI|nr:hypothetical protein TI39_contig4246g00007 [Zymoseptoria brevis]